MRAGCAVQAAAVQALGFIAERTQPSHDDDLIALTICELLLPFTLEPQVCTARRHSLMIDLVELRRALLINAAAAGVYS